MGAFDIEEEEPAPGEFEIGFLIPRDAVGNELGELGEELVELKKEILGPIQELATGTRTDVTVSMISSSEFQVFLEVLPDVAAMLSQIVVELYQAYERIMSIREKLAGLREDDGCGSNAVCPSLSGIECGLIEKLDATGKLVWA